MLIEVTAAGYSSNWQFPGSRRLESWIQGKPWLTHGGLCVVRTRDGSYFEELLRTIERTVRGYHADHGRLDIRLVECGGRLGSPIEAALATLEIDPGLGPFEAREPLRLHLADRSCLLLMTEREAVGARQWEDFVNLVDHYSKASQPIRLCAIVLDARAAVVAEPICDFTTGRATHMVLADAAELDEMVVWKSYLHHRVCWEAGGAPGYALALGAVLESFVCGDDQHVELTLCDTASSTARTQDCLADVVAFAQTNGKTALEIGSKRADSSKEELLEKGCLWRPPGLRRFEIVPWLSRAALCQGSVPAQLVWSFRHNLVCAPLAAEILAQCLSSESQMRMQLHGRSADERLSERSLQSYDRFNEGSDDFIVYPDGHPMPPTAASDKWAFAPLGEVLLACPKSVVPDLFWQTLHLRNAVAHGHYVAWSHVRRAWQHLRRFDVRF